MTNEELNNLYAQQCQILGDLQFKLHLTKKKIEELQDQQDQYNVSIFSIISNIENLNNQAKETTDEQATSD